MVVASPPVGSGYRQGGGRAKGIILTILIYAVPSVLILSQWQSFAPRRAAPTLSTFNVAPPASPEEPVRKEPEGPEQVESKPVPSTLPAIDIPLPVLTVPSPVIPPVEKSVEIQPLKPPAEKTTAPDSRPAPPARQVSSDKATWEGLVLAALDKVKRYPREAQFRRQQGVPYIRFVIDRSGKVLSSSLEKTSGVRSLDDEAVALPKRAQPLPKPPEDRKGETIELVVPVEFFVGD